METKKRSTIELEDLPLYKAKRVRTADVREPHSKVLAIHPRHHIFVWLLPECSIAKGWPAKFGEMLCGLWDAGQNCEFNMKEALGQLRCDPRTFSACVEVHKMRA